MASPTLVLNTDKTLYTQGETITVTATYTDTQTESETVTITGSAEDSQGNTISATCTVTVNSQVPEHMDVEISDNDDRTYTKGSEQPGVVAFTAMA